MSQEVEILRRLETGVTLTPIEALADPDIRSFRLAARIDGLRKSGHEIETVPVHTGLVKLWLDIDLRRWLIIFRPQLSIRNHQDKWLSL